MIVGEGLGLILGGAGVGAVVALGLSTLLRPFLFEVSAREPAILLGGVLFLTVTVLLGCYFPARRAARIDPVTALRSE
jgi:ABC-type antimicrobial peptide transport system permease subunit